MRLSRKSRIWLSAASSVVVPTIITVSGWTGFWPAMGVCAAAVMWTIWLFRYELSHLRIMPDPEATSGHPFWLILPGLVSLAFALYPFLHLYTSTRNQPEPLGFEDVLQSYMHDRRIYISDLARTELIVHDKVFERVTFVGPAVVAVLSGNVLEQPFIDTGGGGIDAVTLVVKENQRSVGAIGLRNCKFLQCRFERIQFLGTQDSIDRIRAGTKDVP
jgi:hypothetical protein